MKQARHPVLEDKTKASAMKIDRDLMGQSGSRQVLVSGSVGAFDFDVSIRRHADWDTYTVDGVVDFSRSEDTEEMISIINHLTVHQMHIYRYIQNKLKANGMLSSRKKDGFLDLGNGRWFYIGGGMASYNTNEYVFDFGEAAGGRELRESEELIENEVRLCCATLRAACQAFYDVGKGEVEFQPSEDKSEEHVAARDPLMEVFVDREKTEEARFHLMEAHYHLQVADAYLCRDDSKTH